MYSETKKDELQDKLQTTEEETSTETEEECQCIYCVTPRQPKLQFVKTKARRWYYQTPSKKNR